MSELEPTRTYSNHTATEVLRRMLDERGVEYRVSATGYSIDIGPSMTAYANRTDTTLDVSLRGYTPEQAIDATLGRGTCRRARPEDYAWDDFECSECGWVTWGFLMEHEGCGTVSQPRYCPNCGRKVTDD